MSFDFSANFLYTGTRQIWTKPPGLTSAYFYVNGAGGGGNSSTSTQQATPQVNLFGGNNNANTFGANGQQSNQGGEMVVKAVVVESDVTSMQKKMNKVQESAVL